MIRDLSQSLRALLMQPGLPTDLAASQIVFDRPVAQFNPQQTSINLFLYDIRENLDLRNNEPIIDRINGQAIIRAAPKRLACTYLITAWVVGGTEVFLQEHDLLTQIFQVFSRYSTIPDPFLQGSLRGQKPLPPIAMTAADGLKNPSEFWSALGTPLRASLTITATLSLTVIEPETVPIAISHRLQLGDESTFQIGGKVTRADNQPISNITIALLERNLTASTDAEGVYRMAALPSGTYTLQVRPPNSAARTFPITVPSVGSNNYNLRI